MVYKHTNSIYNKHTLEPCQAPSASEAVKPSGPGADYLLNELTKLGVEFEVISAKMSFEDSNPPKSYGLDSRVVNADKAKIGRFDRDNDPVGRFRFYRSSLAEKRVLLVNLADSSVLKVVKPADSSRYFAGGRRRIKARIYKRLGRWVNCPGLLLSLTFDPKKTACDDAWRLVGSLRREFIGRVNRWRERRGMPKAKFLAVLEVQKQTGYPHIHLVFPYLRYLAPVGWLVEQWGQASNSVDITVKDSLSPVSYVCKYISKLEGWSDEALAQIWGNGTRLYSMSQDYSLPDYSDKRVPEWRFYRTMSLEHLTRAFSRLLDEYSTMLGADDILERLKVLGGGKG